MKLNYIWIKDGSSMHRISFESILFVRVNGHYCKVHTSQLVYSIKCSLLELLDDLTPNYLTQVHRSFAVNMQQVTGFSRSEVFISTHHIPLGRGFYKELIEKFQSTT
jgi:two-component system, LytTR family, response regulator